MIDLHLLSLRIKHSKLEFPQSENDWVDTAMQPPNSLLRNRQRHTLKYGGLYWTTNFGLSCAASLEGVDRFTKIVEAYDAERGLANLGHLATRVCLTDLKSYNSHQKTDFTFLRQDTAPETPVFTDHGHPLLPVYLKDIVMVLPTEQDDSLRQEILARIDASLGVA